MHPISRAASRRGARLVGIAAAALGMTALSAGAASASISLDTTIARTCFVPPAAAHGLGVVPKDPQTSAAAAAASERQFQAALAAKGIDLNNLAADPVDIQVYVHVVRKNDTVKGGNIPDQWITDLMTYLNDSYHGTGHSTGGAVTPFTFVLAGTDRTTNVRWYKNAVAQGVPHAELAMKRALREPGSTAETLNLYIGNGVRNGLYGIAKFPSSYKTTPHGEVLDGVMIDSQTLPGGSESPFNLGAIGPHEIGHWMGLFHVFQDGCAGAGDEVADTPAMAAASEGCPVGADTCLDDPGEDPIHNYMDYSDDACQNQYTNGQSDRMIAQWEAFRKGVA